jgi:transcriptional regulator with XRE-family HTH domain
MAKFTQKPATKRFIEVFEMLLKDGDVKNQKEFCDRIGYLNTSFSNVLNGLRDIPVSAINGLCDNFQISRDYIFDNKLPIRVSSNPSDKGPAIVSENELNLLRVRVEYLEKINNLLEDQLEQYKTKAKKG